MDAAARKEVQGMIDLAIAQHHVENVERLTRIESRIIGIDGNGTGREGAVQRHDAKLAEISGEVRVIKASVSTLVDRSQSWSKKNIWEFAKWVLGGLGMFVTGIVTLYIAHRLGWR